MDATHEPGKRDRCGCAPTCETCDTTGEVVLRVVWQRLVDPEGETCPRCGTTQAAVEAAVGTLAS